MKSVLAAIVAIGLVVGAVYVRAEFLGDDAPAGDPAEGPGASAAPGDGGAVACDARLGDACPPEAERLGLDELLTTFTEPGSGYGVLVAPDIVVAMIEGSQQSRARFAADPEVLATSPLVLASLDRADDPVAAACGDGDVVDWSCAAEAVADGVLRPGLTDPATASDGLAGLAGLAGGYFTTSGGTFNTNGFDGPFLGWLAAVQDEALVTSAPTENLIRFNGAQNNAALVTEAAAQDASDRASGTALRLRHPQPLVVLSVVAVGVDGVEGDPVEAAAEHTRTALAVAGWRGPDGAPVVDGPAAGDDDGLPSGGVMFALRQRWG